MTGAPTDPFGLLSKFDPNLIGFGVPYLSQELLQTPPLAPSRYAFLLQAVVHVGRATQGSSWQDWETATRYYPAMPKPFLTVEGVLKGHRPPVKPPPVSIANYQRGASYNNGESARYVAERARWEAEAPERLEAAQATVAKAQADWEAGEVNRAAHAPGVEALHAAFRSLSVAIVERKVAPHARLRSGGKVFDIKPDVFANEGLVDRVIREGVLTEGGAQAFLFVDREQLERAFPHGAREGDPSDLHTLYFSPLMQLGIDVIRDWGLNPDNSATVDAIKAQILSVAKLKGVPCTDRQAEETARIVRPVPEK